VQPKRLHSYKKGWRMPITGYANSFVTDSGDTKKINVLNGSSYVNIQFRFFLIDFTFPEIISTRPKPS